MLDWVASWIYSTFLPLQLGTAWFYPGLTIHLPGLILLKLFINELKTKMANKPEHRRKNIPMKILAKRIVNYTFRFFSNEQFGRNGYYSYRHIPDYCDRA